jgi:hypothetical protein
MRPAGRQRSVTVPTTPHRTSSDSLRISAATSLDTIAASDTIAAADTDVVVAPAGLAKPHPATAERRAERHRHLALAIRQRIESRLGGRIHNLTICVRGETVVLEGRCATYYTKQLAQHAALGVLEDEQLDNAIVVTM